MPQFKGTVSRNDLEGGFFQLETPSGEIYTLEGDMDFSPFEGQSVHIDGKEAKSTMSLTMAGPRLTVNRIEAE
jgi:hypothetical protein